MQGFIHGEEGGGGFPPSPRILTSMYNCNTCYMGGLPLSSPQNSYSYMYIEQQQWQCNICMALLYNLHV